MKTFDSRAAGIPCQIRVDEYTVVPPWRGSASTCPSSDDFYGYEEIIYTVLDRRGREAMWLERKITADMDEQILEEIRGQYEQ